MFRGGVVYACGSTAVAGVPTSQQNLSYTLAQQADGNVRENRNLDPSPMLKWVWYPPGNRFVPTHDGTEVKEDLLIRLFRAALS